MTPDETAAKLSTLETLVREQASFISGLKLGQSSSGSTSKLVKEVERVEGPFVPHYRTKNPHAARPNTVTDKPQHYDLCNSPTFALLDSKVSTLKYEFRTAESLLSYMFDATTMLNETLPYLTTNLMAQRSKPLEDSDPDSFTSEEDRLIDDHVWALASLKGTFDEVYRLWSQRGDYIRLKTKFENTPNSITLAERTLLQHLEIKAYGMADGLSLADSGINKALEEFGEKAATATMQYAAKMEAWSDHRQRESPKGKGKGKGKGGKGEKGRKGGPAAGAT